MQAEGGGRTKLSWAEDEEALKEARKACEIARRETNYKKEMATRAEISLGSPAGALYRLTQLHESSAEEISATAKKLCEEAARVADIVVEDKKAAEAFKLAKLCLLKLEAVISTKKVSHYDEKLFSQPMKHWLKLILHWLQLKQLMHLKLRKVPRKKFHWPMKQSQKLPFLEN